MANFTFTATGGAKLGGQAIASNTREYYFTSDGGEVLISGDVGLSFVFSLKILWTTKSTLVITKDFVWGNGASQPLRWYRVQGCCKYAAPTDKFQSGCEATGLEIDDVACADGLGRQQYIQTFLARNVSDLCGQLEETGLVWELCSIKRWSRPVGATAEEHPCNELIPVPFCDIPNCINFCIHTDAIVRIGVTVMGSGEGLDIFGGTVYISGSAATRIVSPGPGVFLQFVSSGGSVSISGSAIVTPSWQSTLLINMGISVLGQDPGVIFDLEENNRNSIVPNNAVVSTNCVFCTGMPAIIYLHHNILKESIFLNFLERNGLEFSTPMTMYFSKRLQSWTANYHLTGTSSDNLFSTESWRFSFEWACVNLVAGDDDSSYLWKFSMLAVRKNEISGYDVSSRILVTFPPEEICSSISNLDIDFNFSVNSITNFVKLNLDIAPNTILFNDDIGLFKSKSWTNTPNINFRLSRREESIFVQRQDIFPIFPLSIREESII